MNIARTGKSALIAAGAGFGVLQSLRILGNISQSASRIRTLDARIDTLHVAVARLAEQSVVIQADLDQRVTKDELSETIERVFRQLDRGFEERFERQARSVEALRLMVGQTDELLQRVLDGLETLKSEEVRGPNHGAERWDLSPARH
jgi:hypothetical protein